MNNKLNIVERMKIEQRHIDAIKQYLGDENLRYFRHLKGLKGEVFPTLRLNQKKKLIPVHSVYLREGMQIRNWMRRVFIEFRNINMEEMDKLSVKLVESAIK